MMIVGCVDFISPLLPIAGAVAAAVLALFAITVLLGYLFWIAYVTAITVRLLQRTTVCKQFTVVPLSIVCAVAALILVPLVLLGMQKLLSAAIGFHATAIGFVVFGYCGYLVPGVKVIHLAGYLLGKMRNDRPVEQPLAPILRRFDYAFLTLSMSLTTISMVWIYMERGRAHASSSIAPPPTRIVTSGPQPSPAPQAIAQPQPLAGTPQQPVPTDTFDKAKVIENATSQAPALRSPPVNYICEQSTAGASLKFEWDAIKDATRYHLHVIGPNARYPVVDTATLQTVSYTYVLRGYVIGKNARGWRWKVRAMVEDRWTDWSEPRVFHFGPQERPVETK